MDIWFVRNNISINTNFIDTLMRILISEKCEVDNLISITNEQNLLLIQKLIFLGKFKV